MSVPEPGRPTEPEPMEPVEVEAAVAQNLERLRQLSIVDVTGLVIDLPAEATACYGGPPCPGHESAYMEALALQSPRLAQLTDIATEVAAAPSVDARDHGDAVTALDSLSALRIVEVAGLIQSTPQNNPVCYNLPCGEDIAAANAENQLRVARVYAIVEAAEVEGL